MVNPFNTRAVILNITRAVLITNDDPIP